MRNNGNLLVTGSTGFIGGRIIETLFLGKEPNFKAGIHTWGTAARIGRFPIEFSICDVLDEEKIRQAMDGVNCVIHCAVGPREVIVDGTKNMLKIALEKKVERFVQISTGDVYGNVTGEINETFPFKYSGNEYSDAKIDAEKLCWEYYEKGLPISVIRPGIVYGPFGQAWTIRFAERLLSGNWGIFQDTGEGICNLIYVDDLVSGIFSALENPNAVGEAFNIVGPDMITWNEYFNRLNDSLGLPPLKQISESNNNFRSSVMDPSRSFAKLIISKFDEPVRKIYDRYSFAKLVMKKMEKSIKTTPSKSELALFSRQVTLSNQKAKKELGFTPQYDIEAGIDMSTKWLNHESLI